jgi:type IX secretion system substrate protein
MIMRKFAFCFALLSLLVSNKIAAQLYVSNNYLYVADNYLFVKQDVNLQASGNIFLRNESQLLQGSAGASANQGVGELSVFQEGTSNNFAYNYWCSPVGASLASVGNSDFGISQLNRATGITNISSAPATILASTALDGTTNASSLSIAQRWIFKFLSSTTYSQWFYVGSAATIAAGEGFTMKGTSGTDATTVIGVQNNPGSRQRYDFRGKPNDGNINVSVIGTAGNMTLTGNPYPSTIDLDLFLTDPGNTPLIDGTALFWEHDPTVNSHLIVNYRGGYGIYNGSSGIYTPATFYNYDAAGNEGSVASTPMNSYERKFCPVGQGFMVRGIAPGNVQFKNSYRVFKNEGAANNSEFHRLANSHASVANYGFYDAIPNVAGTDYTQISKAPTPHININASLNGQAVRQVALCFTASAVDGLDRADSKSADTNLNLPSDMYLYLDAKEYIHSATSFDINKRFPVGFKNTAEATFKIQVADFINFTGAETVYLYDKQTNIYHDIRSNQYEMTLPAGVHNDRFEFTFVNGALNVAALHSDAFDVVQNNIAQMLIIANPKIMDVKSVVLYDISGKAIFNKTKLGAKNTYQFSTSGISDGVYVVKITTNDSQDFNKKITVYNGK